MDMNRQYNLIFLSIFGPLEENIMKVIVVKTYEDEAIVMGLDDSGLFTIETKDNMIYLYVRRGFVILPFIYFHFVYPQLYFDLLFSF